MSKAGRAAAAALASLGEVILFVAKNKMHRRMHQIAKNVPGS